MSESLQALRRTNPRRRPGFSDSVDAAADVIRAQIETATGPVPRPIPLAPRRRFRRVTLATAAVGAAGMAALMAVVLPSGGPTIENAAAAVTRAATVTAASADQSGTAVVRITHNSEVWVAKTVRWHGENLSVSTNAPERQACVQRFGPARCGKAGSKTLLVDGRVYGIDPEDGRWVMLGSPKNIDANSGTTPGEVLAAVREDVGGETLERITGGMTGLTAAQRDDGSTVYSGTVAAGLIARETGFKEGKAIRVLPFGNVAHGEAADPDGSLAASIRVGADGIVREITVTWDTWVYNVAYSRLGETPAPGAPAHARNLLKERLRSR
jgi:hypothetical protein